MDAERRMTIGGSRALAAEMLLECKRIELESAIEALETVGYLVKKDELGKYKVIQPFPITDESNCDLGDVADTARSEFLGEYPEILSAEQAAEILNVSKRTVTRLCASSRLPSFKAGNMVRIPKRALIDAITKQTS